MGREKWGQTLMPVLMPLSSVCEMGERRNRDGPSCFHASSCLSIIVLIQEQTMPRIVRFHQTGGPEVLKIEEEPLVQPKQGEVRLRVQALGLNRAEAMFRSGAYLEVPQLPSRLGYEAAGVVDAIGPGVSSVKIGDRVSTIPAFSLNAHGVYGESAVVPALAV